MLALNLKIEMIPLVKAHYVRATRIIDFKRFTKHLPTQAYLKI